MAELKNTIIDDTSYLQLPSGTTAERPTSPVVGMVRHNTTLNTIEFFDGSNWTSYSYFPYVSENNVASFGWFSGPSDVKGETDDILGCSGLLTFEQALDYAHSIGARLPTRAEVIQSAAEGTGCGYDAELIWTIDAADNSGNIHYVVIGDPEAYGYSEEIRNNSDTAYVRFVADVDTSRIDVNMICDPFVYSYLYGAIV